MPYREADLSRLTTVPVARRANKVDPSLLAGVPGPERSFRHFLESLPDVLAARALDAPLDGVPVPVVAAVAHRVAPGLLEEIRSDGGIRAG